MRMTLLKNPKSARLFKRIKQTSKQKGEVILEFVDFKKRKQTDFSATLCQKKGELSALGLPKGDLLFPLIRMVLDAFGTISLVLKSRSPIYKT